MNSYAIYDPSTGQIICNLSSSDTPAVFMQAYPDHYDYVKAPAEFDFNDETHHVVDGKITPI